MSCLAASPVEAGHFLVYSGAGPAALRARSYEEFLTGPILRSLIENPTALVAVANDHWTQGTRIPESQFAAVRAWFRLVGVPAVAATNR